MSDTGLLSSLVTSFLSLFSWGDEQQPPVQQQQPVQQQPVQQPAQQQPVQQQPVQQQPVQQQPVQQQPVQQQPMQQQPVQQQPAEQQPEQQQPVEQQKPKTEPEAASKERTEFLDRLSKLSEALSKIDERVKKLTSPPAPITQALQVANDAKAAAEKAGEVKPEDWPKANTALDDLQNDTNKVNTACLDEAGKLVKAFDLRYTAKDKNKPAGKEIVAKYIAYGKAKKTLDGLISGKDGLGAMEACPATETALAEFETTASPTATQKQEKAKAAFDLLKTLSDKDLGEKPLQEQAELALELCANGTPTGSTQVTGSNPAKFLPTVGSTLEQLCRLYKLSKPDPKFMEKRATQREQIADEVVKMDEIKKLYKPNGDLDNDYWDNFVKDADKVLKMMQDICNVQADAMGMARISVSKAPDPPKKNGTMGGYNPATNSIGLNFFPGYLKPVSEAIDTIIHETFHAHQDVIVKKLKAGDIGPGDDDYATALMYMVNDIPVGYVGSGSVGSDNYKTQPTEFDSFHHAEKTAESVLSKAKAAAKGTGV
jgi:hypothetical protein